MAKRVGKKIDIFANSKNVAFPIEKTKRRSIANRGGSDSSPPSIPGDLNNDGTIDGQDLTLLLAGWNTTDPQYDVNGDGLVDGADLTLLLASWGTTQRSGQRVGKKPTPKFQNALGPLTPIDVHANNNPMNSKGSKSQLTVGFARSKNSSSNNKSSGGSIGTGGK